MRPRHRHANRTGQGDFVRQRQNDFDGRAVLDVLGQEKVDAARADVLRFGARLSDGRSAGPANRHRQFDSEALGCAPFGISQVLPPDSPVMTRFSDLSSIRRKRPERSIEHWDHFYGDASGSTDVLGQSRAGANDTAVSSQSAKRGFADGSPPVRRENILEREHADQAPRVGAMHHRKKRRVAQQPQRQVEGLIGM